MVLLDPKSLNRPDFMEFRFRNDYEKDDSGDAEEDETIETLLIKSR